MLRRLVQRGLLELELLTQGARALGQALDFVGARLERRHGRIDFPDATLCPFDSRDRRRHEFLDPRRFIGTSGERPEALVRTLHPHHQLATALIELRAECGEVGQPLVQVLHHAAAGVDLPHRL